MEKGPFDFDMKQMGKAVANFVRARAIKAGSHIIYMENDQMIEEDPSTGEKIVIKPTAPKAD